jgi:hypothetical protein
MLQAKGIKAKAMIQTGDTLSASQDYIINNALDPAKDHIATSSLILETTMARYIYLRH